MSGASRRVFFFPHALRPSGKSPGRVPFEVEATLVNLSGLRTRGKVVVIADGFATNTVGTNQDPCVFSAPLGPVHSFCRIDFARGKDHYVKKTGHLLSQEVTHNDVVIYGKFEPLTEKTITRVWVDTVIVAGVPQPWPTVVRSPGTKCANAYCKGRKRCRRFIHTDPVEFAAHLGAHASSNLVKVNLSDGGPKGAHSCTSVADYRVIIGKVSKRPKAVPELATSFCPLAENGDGWKPAGVEQADVGKRVWKRIVEFLVSEVRGDGTVRGGSIVEFEEPNDAWNLIGALISKSGAHQQRLGFVAIPPLEPSGRLWRWDPARKRRTVLRSKPRSTERRK